MFGVAFNFIGDIFLGHFPSENLGNVLFAYSNESSVMLT